MKASDRSGHTVAQTSLLWASRVNTATSQGMHGKKLTWKLLLKSIFQHRRLLLIFLRASVGTETPWVARAAENCCAAFSIYLQDLSLTRMLLWSFCTSFPLRIFLTIKIELQKHWVSVPALWVWILFLSKKSQRNEWSNSHIDGGRQPCLSAGVTRFTVFIDTEIISVEFRVLKEWVFVWESRTNIFTL